MSILCCKQYQEKLVRYYFRKLIKIQLVSAKKAYFLQIQFQFSQILKICHFVTFGKTGCKVGFKLSFQWIFKFRKLYSSKSLSRAPHIKKLKSKRVKIYFLNAYKLTLTLELYVCLFSLPFALLTWRILFLYIFELCLLYSNIYYTYIYNTVAAE